MYDPLINLMDYMSLISIIIHDIVELLKNFRPGKKKLNDVFGFFLVF